MIYKVDFIVQIHSLLNGQVTAKNMTKYGFSLTYFFWSTESTTMSLYGKIRVRENSCSSIFYTVSSPSEIAICFKKNSEILSIHPLWNWDKVKFTLPGQYFGKVKTEKTSCCCIHTAYCWRVQTSRNSFNC